MLWSLAQQEARPVQWQFIAIYKIARDKTLREIMPIENAVYLRMSHLWLNKVCPSDGSPTWAHIRAVF